VVVPLRRVLSRCEVVAGAVTRVTHAEHRVEVQPAEGPALELRYDLLVVALGSVSRLLPIPGLADVGIGFKTVGEAIYLRNHVLACLDLAAVTPDPAVRRRALTFVFVGGGYAGVEALAELEDMARSALRQIPGIEESDMRWVLVEAAGRIMAEVSTRLSGYTVARLAERRIEVKLETRLESAQDGHVQLSDGESFDADTVVWTAGVKANPVLQDTDLPKDDAGRLPCAANLRVKGVTGVFAAGDCAAVPDLTAKDPKALCGPSAQHAVRQSKTLADNVIAVCRGGSLRDYRHRYAGSVASLGLYRGVAEIYGVKLRGPLAWFMHRTYHVSRMPTFNRKVRIVADWTGALLFRREVVSLGQIQSPRAEFLRAAGRRAIPVVE
jgi:NADH dehydrogenase